MLIKRRTQSGHQSVRSCADASFAFKYRPVQHSTRFIRFIVTPSIVARDADINVGLDIRVIAPRIRNIATASACLRVFSTDDSATSALDGRYACRETHCAKRKPRAACTRAPTILHARARIMLSARARRGMWTLSLVFAETSIAPRNNGNINCADCAIVDPPPENEVRPRGWRVRFLRTRVFYALLRERILMNIRERNLEILRFSLTRFLLRTKGQKNSHFEVIKGRMKGERKRERKRERERERGG